MGSSKPPGVPWYTGLFGRRRLTMAKSLATELAARWRDSGLSESDLPVEWRPENLVAKLFRSLYCYSADQVRDEWRSIFDHHILAIEREQLITDLTPRLKRIFLTKQEELLETLLIYCTLEELTRIKESLLFNFDEVGRQILLNKLMLRQQLEPDDSRRASSKGSIGHDRLNVKTLRPSEWRARAAALTGRMTGAAGDRPSSHQPLFSSLSR